MCKILLLSYVHWNKNRNPEINLRNRKREDFFKLSVVECGIDWGYENFTSYNKVAGYVIPRVDCSVYVPALSQKPHEHSRFYRGDCRIVKNTLWEAKERTLGAFPRGNIEIVLGNFKILVISCFSLSTSRKLNRPVVSVVSHWADYFVSFLSGADLPKIPTCSNPQTHLNIILI